MPRKTSENAAESTMKNRVQILFFFFFFTFTIKDYIEMTRET